ncbi:hypothetical protein A1342_20560 [Methylomonas methanica]|uniref:Uncharacterized protein n=2 Tax=Methylomonas TaxID=416 RepID=A0A126T6C8_9GAMM|nr:hypothetical protein JT25_012690 [Methylomonas denitrificans]OAI08840.1 hypothetical protein A1342_20560 [Methylomonas methanica]
MLTSSLAMAGSDYPAADYQPKVLYTNPDYNDTKAAPAAAAPVAKSAAKEVEADPTFPATNFQPKVLYSDAGYKHSAAAPSAAQSSKSSASATSAEAAVDVIQTEKAGSSDFSYIGLGLLAVVGFFIYNKKSPKSAKGSSADDYQVATGATGVEKYLEKMGANKTGVAKYLEKQDSNPATGVAKYMAKQIVRDREAAAAKATGVEKYLRDKV